MTTATVDKTRMDAFAARMLDVLNGGALALPAAGAGELLWRALRLPGQPPLTRAGVGLFGEAGCVPEQRGHLD